eukprot:215270-Chlamydomonas_euryale.AAC.3
MIDEAPRLCTPTQQHRPLGWRLIAKWILLKDRRNADTWTAWQREREKREKLNMDPWQRCGKV